jgi:hypothetical protein
VQLLERFASPNSPARLYAELPATPARDAAQPTTTAGSDSPSPYAFQNLWNDTNPDILPPTRFFTYNQMRNEDSAIRSALWMFKLAIRAADWSLEPAGENPLDRMIADAVAWNFGYEDKLGVMDLSADEQHQQALLMLDFGSMFEEIAWGDVKTWTDADGDEHLLRPIARLAPRFPATFRYPNGIDVNARTGFVNWIEQTLPGTRRIPGDSLSYYALEREGSDWLGRSLLRAMYGPWKLKRAVMISAGIGWDRYAFGTPVVRYPLEGGAGKKREAEAIGRNWRTHERGWVVLEGTQAQGWDVEIVGGNSTMSDPSGLIRLYNDEIAMSAMQHFTQLGRTGSGSRAVGEVQVEPFYLASQAIADHVAMQKMRLAFRRFVDENFGPDLDVPRLNVSKIMARNVLVMAQALSYLADAGFSFTDPDTQNDIRDYLDLRHMPEAVQQVIESGDVGVEQSGGLTLPPGSGGQLPTGPPALVMREGDDLGL